MKKSIFNLLVRLLVFLASSIFFTITFPKNTEAISFTSVKYESTTSEVTSSRKLLFTSKEYIKDDRMRIDATTSTGENIITIIKGKDVYICYIDKKKAIKTKRTLNVEEYFDLEKLGAKKIGEEEINNVLCDVYEYIEPKDKYFPLAFVKGYFWSEAQFPVRLEKTIRDKKIIVEIKNIEFNPVIDEKIFEIPKEIEVIKTDR